MQQITNKSVKYCPANRLAILAEHFMRTLPRTSDSRRLRCAQVLSLVVALFMTNAGFSQTTFGTVVGLVTDSSGAVVSGAKVTITNQETNQARTMQTSAAGTYSFVNQNPGTYRVDVEGQGFKHFARTGVEVQVGGTARADAMLEVGNVSESVQVTASAPLIQTDSSNLGGVIEGRSVQDMPLSGRNVNNLLTLVPGVIAQGSTYGNISTNLIAFGNYQIGGGFGNQSIFFIDGVLSNVPWNNANAMIPSQDSVREFRVSTNNVSAEFGLFAGGVVNISSKYGTNRFHGTAYEYLRNKVLNANDFFSNRAGRARPPYVQNQFGFTLGGPIIKNKTFFFGGFERQPVTSGNLSTTTVPTKAEMSGDFTAAGLPKIYDPLTGQQFQCNGVLNVICPNRIDPAVTALLKQDYPADATDPTKLSSNYITTTKTIYANQQINARVDHSFSDRDVAFGRYTHWTVHSLTTNPYPGVPAFEPPHPGGFINDEAIVGNTFTLNPTTIFDGRLAYLRVYQFTYPRGLGTDISGISPGLAAMQTALGQKIPTAFSFVGTGIAGSTGPAQLYWFGNGYTVSGSVTKILGRHTVKSGFFARDQRWTASPDSGGNVFVFTSQITASPSVPGSGHAVASGLLGTPINTTAQAIGGSRAFFHSYGFFVNDDFQFSKKLTVNAGVRWDQPGSYSEVNNWNTVVLPDAVSPLGTINNPATGAKQALKGELALVHSADYPGRREENLHYNLFSPRVGFAYRVTDSMVVRAGYGMSYLPPTLSQDGPNSSSVNTAVSNNVNSISSATNKFTNVITTVANPFPAANPILTPGRGDASRLVALYGQNIQSRIPNQAYSYVQQWNLAIERQFAGDTSISVSYAGSKGTRLQAQGANTWSAANINQLPDSYLTLGTDLETKLPNPFLGNAAAGTLGNSATILKGQLLRPFPQYNYVTAAGSRNSFSIYHALQTSFKKRLGQGGQVTVAYTWSKLLSNTDSITQFLEGTSGYAGTVQNNNDLHQEKSLSSSDYPQSVTIGYVLDLPFGAQQRWLSSAHGVAGVLINGWRVNGLTSFRAGTPLGILARPNRISTAFGGGGYYQSTITGTGTTRPNVVPGCQKQPISSGLERVNAGSWFNTACFVYPGDYSYGNESRTDSQLRRDGVKNFDFSAQKNTKLTEGLMLTFTAEFFNIFNRVQFGAPSTAAYDGANFGKVTAQYNNPRQIQFGLRLTY